MGNSNSLYYLGSHLDYLDQQLERGLLMRGTRVFVSLWLLWGALSAQVS